MLLFVVVSLVAGLNAKPNLQAFSTYLREEGKAYLTAAETKLRYGLYREAAALLQEHNSDKARTWDMGLNQFSTMTDSEKQRYLGLANETVLSMEHLRRDGLLRVGTAGNVAAADSVDHVSTGIVTGVKNQGGCGSCWAFAATASMEGMYAARTWRLKDFADQELLDCSYGDSYNGCGGGWYNKPWDYIARSKHLSLRRDVGYHATDRACNYGHIHNAVANVKVSSQHTWVKAGDDNLKNAIYTAVPAVAITVESDFYGYKSGIYNGCPTQKSIHHAVTAVGYDQHAWKIKNSWGSGWGEGGYIRMSRGKSSICRVADFAMFPNVDFMDGTLVYIKNAATNRYVVHWNNLEDVRDKAASGGYGDTKITASDANYYNLGIWVLHHLGDNKYFVKHFHSGRYLFVDGNGKDIRGSRGAEGGWTVAPGALGVDANYYHKTVWRIPTVKSPTTDQFIEHDITGRYLFAAGSEANGGEPRVKGVDANYYNYALWKVIPLTAADKNRMIASG